MAHIFYITSNVRETVHGKYGMTNARIFSWLKKHKNTAPRENAFM